MGALIALDSLLSQRRVWRGPAVATSSPTHPTGYDELDRSLPSGGWPDAALTEVLLPADGIGELQLLWPALARLSRPKESVIVLVAPPYRPYAPAWHAAGVRLGALQIIHSRTPREALWAAEQCLRSGACHAVLCWPQQADDRALRRLQVAAETGQALGFAFRPLKTAVNPSPAALRLALETRPRQLRVLKCRGGTPPSLPIPFPHSFAKDNPREDGSGKSMHVLHPSARREVPASTAQRIQPVPAKTMRRSPSPLVPLDLERGAALPLAKA